MSPNLNPISLKRLLPANVMSFEGTPTAAEYTAAAYSLTYFLAHGNDQKCGAAIYRRAHKGIGKADNTSEDKHTQENAQPVRAAQGRRRIDRRLMGSG